MGCNPDSTAVRAVIAQPIAINLSCDNVMETLVRDRHLCNPDSKATADLKICFCVNSKTSLSEESVKRNPSQLLHLPRSKYVFEPLVQI